MIYDLNEIKNDPFDKKQFDVCIVGGGIAGITLAMYLDKKLNILLLEAGGLEYSQESQDVYKGKNIGHEYFELDATRIRCLGGTSNVWGGYCAPLSKFDFKKRDYLKYSGWPIKKEDLAPYIEEAASILDLPEKSQSIYYQGWSDVLYNSDENLKKHEFKWSWPPTNFRDKYKEELEERSNISCFINANLTDMTLLDNLSSVEKIEIKNYRGAEYSASAKIYILATGGIENARLLLNFNKQCKNGIGNKNSLVGRFFTEHPTFITGKFIMNDHVKRIFASHKPENNYTFRINYLTPSKKYQKNEKVLNFHLRIESDMITSRSILQSYFKEEIKQIICSVEWTQMMLNKFRSKKIACLPKGNGQIRISLEQALNPASRITLGNEVDKFGLKRIKLNWQLQKIDKSTCKKATFHIAKLFAKQNLGRIKIQNWVLDEDAEFPGFPQEVGCHHHMCTTRMGVSPSEGVVDKDQQVFGVNNLYIAGCSVFATAGQVNPTFAIVQTSLRLADHLNEKLLRT